MGFFKRLQGNKKEEKENAEKLVREYVDAHVDSLMVTWISMQEELQDFNAIERKELLKDEFAKITRTAGELLKNQKIKVPPHLFQIVREEINEKTIERLKPHLEQFVSGYRRTYLQWPHDTDIPLKDLDKLKAVFKENGITLEVLNYDLSEEKIRSLLIQHGIRRKPEFQNTETWSKNFSYSHDDMILLGEVLKSRGIKVQGIEHMLGDLWILVKQELLRQQDQQFKTSFLAANPNLPPVPSPIDWALAYAKTLKTDMDFIEYAERMARMTGTVFEKGELEKIVKDILSGNIPRVQPGKSLKK
ncbi:MAG: hypothetical protein GXY50_04810 [Syntrophomonadaceae bacterium]|nr:hypothetical protein [Syntrophomonadaceae bacterium]